MRKILNFFNGKKTYLGAALVAVSAGLRVLGENEASDIILAIGGTLGLIGVRHAVSKGA